MDARTHGMVESSFLQLLMCMIWRLEPVLAPSGVPPYSPGVCCLRQNESKGQSGNDARGGIGKRRPKQ